MGMLLGRFLALALLVTSCTPARDVRTARYQPPPALDDGWKTTSAEVSVSTRIGSPRLRSRFVRGLSSVSTQF